jgi:hypothetical protein
VSYYSTALISGCIGSNEGMIFFIFLLLPLEHWASVKRFVSLQFLNLIDSR